MSNSAPNRLHRQILSSTMIPYTIPCTSGFPSSRPLSRTWFCIISSQLVAPPRSPSNVAALRKIPTRWGLAMHDVLRDLCVFLHFYLIFANFLACQILENTLDRERRPPPRLRSRCPSTQPMTPTTPSPSSYQPHHGVCFVRVHIYDNFINYFPEVVFDRQHRPPHLTASCSLYDTGANRSCRWTSQNSLIVSV